mmetsp:Transcript_47339/g.34631  ORF Transcript_47339/g.34631 Transcript_47339/m.34631 type:complete len:111 (+) Transcript_47339:382-714(+)
MMEKVYRGHLILLLETVSMLQKIDKNDYSQQLEFRLLTPILKQFSSKESVRVISEGLECFGGLGYIESSHLPSILRDAHVNTIWEGTTNILALDFVNTIFRNYDSCLKVF